MKIRALVLSLELESWCARDNTVLLTFLLQVGSPLPPFCCMDRYRR